MDDQMFHKASIFYLSLICVACQSQSTIQEQSIYASIDRSIIDIGPKTPDHSLTLDPCQDPALQLIILDPKPSIARYGTAFSNILYQDNDPQSANPIPLKVALRTQDQQPVPNCEIEWQTDPLLPSWVFPISEQTDQTGTVSAWWIASDHPSPKLTIKVKQSTLSQVLTGEAYPSDQTRTDSVHIHYGIDQAYDEITVQVQPLNASSTSYYSTINLPGAYTGIQFETGDQNDRSQVSCGGHSATTCAQCPQGNGSAWCNGDCMWVDGACVNGTPVTKVIFSVWDEPTGNAQIIDMGQSNEQVGFGGEGTGTSLRLMLPPSRFGAIEGLPNDYQLQADHIYETRLKITYPSDCMNCQDYQVFFYDLTRNLGPIDMGKQRYHQRVPADYAIGFIEDWLDVPGDHCINSQTRSAYFKEIKYRQGEGEWLKVNSARFNSVYLPENREICLNIAYGADDQGFFLSSGGKENVSFPLFGQFSASYSLP